MTTAVVAPRDLRALVGRELGPSPSIVVDQARIDAFAACTEDDQWLHTDPERAADGPFGRTVAHGFLTLSLLIRLWSDTIRVDGSVAVNYGLERVRFPAPVPAGSEIRARFVVDELTDIAGGVQARIGATVERDGSEKPVCVAQLILRFLE